MGLVDCGDGVFLLVSGQVDPATDSGQMVGRDLFHLPVQLANSFFQTASAGNDNELVLGIAADQAVSKDFPHRLAQAVQQDVALHVAKAVVVGVHVVDVQENGGRDPVFSLHLVKEFAAFNVEMVDVGQAGQAVDLAALLAGCLQFCFSSAGRQVSVSHACKKAPFGAAKGFLVAKSRW